MNMIESRGILIQEAKELLENMELALLDIEEHGASSDRINEIFRAAHTIKGSSGIFGFDLIVNFTHVMENLLVKVRNKEIDIDSSMTSLLLNCGDYLEAIVDRLEATGNLIDPDSELREHLVKQLNAYIQNDEERSQVTNHSTETKSEPGIYKVQLKPSAQLLQDGLDPIPFISYLGNASEILEVRTLVDQLPDLFQLNTELCYLAFEVSIRTSLTESAIRESFQFFEESCAIDIEKIYPLGKESQSQEELTHQKSLQEKTADENFAIAEEIKSDIKIELTEKSQTASTAGKKDAAMIKIDARKLDQLINSVGELVIRSASGRRIEKQVSNTQFHEYLEEIDHFIEQIRERALSLRMAPVGDVFQRFPRLIRDLSKELGKKVELQIEGADTEIDKLMLDKLGDPLTHIIRNAMDHGIEVPAKRLAAGKNEQGIIQLSAFHDSGWVVIDILDDGNGLNKERILKKALEKNLIESAENLTDKEIYKLIFEAGFSTAEKITDISGRGVGMDVVISNIKELRGTVDIDSEPGQGSHFRIRLPLTLSIIDGFQVSVEDSQFVIPLEHIVECIDMPNQVDSRQLVNLRGEPLPYIRLRDQFSIEAADHSIEQKKSVHECLVVLDVGGNRAGIVVDKLVGELQAVIKPLNRLLRGVSGIGGSTILGDGHVALILDVNALISKAKR